MEIDDGLDTGLMALGGDEPPVIEVIGDVEVPIEERLRKSSSLHGEILSKLISRRNAAKRHIEQRTPQWTETSNRLRMFIDLKSKQKKVDGSTDPTKLNHPWQSSVVVPASYSIQHVLLTQLMGIFGSREPLIQIRGRGPEDVTSGRVLEQVLAYDCDQMNAYRSMHALCRDSLAFGTGVIYDYWATEYGEKTVRRQPDMSNPEDVMLSMLLGPSAFVEKQRGVVKEYNQWQPVDPFKFYPDPRCPIGLPQEGEFIGHRFFRGLMYLLERSGDEGPYFNVDDLRSIGGVAGRSDDRSLGVGDFSNDSFDDSDEGSYDLDHLQVRLIPREWDLGPSDRPEIWWFTWANDTVIIRAHQSPYEHNRFTYAVAESDPDFHSAFNPGIVESVDGLQRYMDWMFNTHVLNLQRHLNDAMILSPALVNLDDVTHPSPGRHIRLTPLGEELVMQGYNINSFIHQLPIQDVTAPHLNAMNQMFSLAQRMTAANDPQMGMPTEDKRTLGEIQVITASASARIGAVARLIDTMAIKPLSERAIQNRLQFTEIEQFYNIVGDYANEASEEFILAGRDSIQGNFDYIPNSGVNQPDPVRMARTWAQVLETLARMAPVMPPSPDGKVPDLNRIAKEQFKALGAKNIEEFFTQQPEPPQVMPDEQVQQEVDAGNMVPMDPAQMAAMGGAV